MFIIIIYLFIYLFIM